MNNYVKLCKLNSIHTFQQEQDSQVGESLSKTSSKPAQNDISDCYSEIPFQMVEEMLKKTKCLCSLIDSSMVDEVFDFLEMNRITVKPEKVKIFKCNIVF